VRWKLLTRTLRVAVARRGAAVVVLPGDAALKPLSAKVPKWLVPSRPHLRPDEHGRERLPSLLSEAKRVTRFSGAGCAGAYDEVLAPMRSLNRSRAAGCFTRSAWRSWSAKWRPTTQASSQKV
jgi:pyruvate dehydrogenase (quinone)